MKRMISALFVAAMLLPIAFATNTGIGITPEIETERFEPLVWLCDERYVFDDNTEPGRWPTCQDHQCGGELGDEPLLERLHNYAFEGEQISWLVLVMDKNGINKVKDVFATIGSTQGAGNDIEVNCIEAVNPPTIVLDSCDAKILQEDFSGRQIDNAVQRYYQCTLTVETPDSMYGEYWLTVEANDLDGLSGTMAENEYWFFNPVIALTIDGSMYFPNVRPGTSAYSETLLLGNDADIGSGVMLDMFISGTDFYDSSSSGAMCPYTNQLSLSAFNYFASQGAYTTKMDGRADAAGYVPIRYGIGFNDPNPFYGNNEVMQTLPTPNAYHPGNILSPGAQIALTFRLNLPEPCNGDFDTGRINFWGEAI